MLAVRVCIVFCVLLALVALAQRPAYPTPQEAESEEEPGKARTGVSLSEEREASKSELEMLAQAIQAMKVAKEKIARVTVSSAQPESGFVGGAVVSVGLGQETGKAFEGDLEYCWSEDETELLISVDRFPGIELLSTRSMVVQRATFSDASYDIKDALGEISSLLDGEGLERWLLKEEITVSINEEAEFVYRADVSPRLIHTRPSNRSMNQFLGETRALRVQMELTLGAGPTIKWLRSEIVHNDPMASLMRGQGAVMPGVEPQKEQSNGETEGTRSIYECTFVPKASERTETARTALRELLAEAEKDE